MNLGIRQACEPVTPAKHFHWINNNFCIYYKDANYYANNCPKANQKTILQEIVIYEKEEFISS